MPLAAGLYFTVSGQEGLKFPNIILVHGAGSNNLCWPAELRRLSGYRILALDLPGHGRSTGVALQTIEGYAEHVISFLDALDLQTAILIGHSMGGAIALNLGFTQPKRIAGLGLVASGAYLGGESDILEHLSNPVSTFKALKMIEERAFAPLTDSGLIKRTMSILHTARHGMLYSDFRACASFDLRMQIPLIGAPCWVAVGEEDRLTPPDYAAYLADNLPDASLQVIPGAGHMLMLEATQALSLGLRAFLERITFRDQIRRLRDPSLTRSEVRKNAV